MNARFCTHCGASLEEARRELPCGRCQKNNSLGTRIVVSCCVMQGERLLWIRRALQPRRGFWAIPGGFLECGETLAQAASRELLEEAGLEIDARELRLHGFGSVKHMNQVYVVYRADVGEVTLRPGEEALEARFFSEAELPWNEIAFPAVNYLVRTTYADMRAGRHGLYLADHDRAVHVDQISAVVPRNLPR